MRNTFNNLELNDLIRNHAQGPNRFVVWCARAGNFDDLCFNTTVNLDRLTFVFSGFAVNGSVKSLDAKLFSCAFNGVFFNFKIFCDLLVGMFGTVGVGLEQDFGVGDGSSGMCACSGEAGQFAALFVGKGDDVFFHGFRVAAGTLVSTKRVTIH